MSNRDLFLLYWMLYTALTLSLFVRVAAVFQQGNPAPLVIWFVVWLPGTIGVGYVIAQLLNRRRR